MAKHTLVIACDGPARAGKTTLANNFEHKLGIPCLNTGKIYRALSVLAMRQLHIDSFDGLTEDQIIAAVTANDLTKLRITFSGAVYYDEIQFDELMKPEISMAVHVITRIKRIRSEIVEPLVIKLVEDCDYPLVISEGRDEGRLWNQAGRLGLAIFLSVDPVVAAIRERTVRQALHYEKPQLREIMNTLMSFDLDNASRANNPTYIAENPVVFTGTVSREIRQAIATKSQIIVSTSSIDASATFKRVLRLVDAAGLLNESEKHQVALL